MEGLLHYLEEEEEEKDKEDKEVSNKPEKGSDGSNEAAKPSGLPKSASTMEDNRGSLLPTAYTSLDKRLRLPRLTSPQKRPREGKGKDEGPRKGKRKVKHVRWADAALLEEVFPFFMDSPVDPSAPRGASEPLSSSSASPVHPGEQEGFNPATQALEAHPTSLSTGAGTPTLDWEARTGEEVGGENGAGFRHASWQTVSVVTRRKDMPSSLPPLQGRWAHPLPSSSPAPEPARRENVRAKEDQEESSAFEFFCDACLYTLEEDEVRYECQVCPGEFCLCRTCYAKQFQPSPSTLSSTQATTRVGPHPHPCLPNTSKVHITSIPKGLEKGKEHEEQPWKEHSATVEVGNIKEKEASGFVKEGEGDRDKQSKQDDSIRMREGEATDTGYDEGEEEDEEEGPLLGPGGGPRFGKLKYTGSL
ncbi:hypothetical protein NSK_006588 [Nannochloropsis salina CCMP1776]|uniref:ZZ-type domain-containing protein n=1 Tax=Nannochloropsis salina CCMP1776 TaxID=1027361 RepID=A0A4D9CRX2_9STRA|nr:hypothetical protein NSK_006588 [Nannochloropsis salina CCMP1776]|eukprot:TFJ81920.1 hypothetical protein NSK_006588 [Nannochloropsis salina CCMP1776]